MTLLKPWHKCNTTQHIGPVLYCLFSISFSDGPCGTKPLAPPQTLKQHQLSSMLHHLPSLQVWRTCYCRRIMAASDARLAVCCLSRMVSQRWRGPTKRREPPDWIDFAVSKTTATWLTACSKWPTHEFQGNAHQTICTKWGLSKIM